MEKMIEKIKDFLGKEKLFFDYSEKEKIFTFDLDMGGILGVLRVIIYVKEKGYIVNCLFNAKAEEKNILEVSEFLHRANNGLINGNFELNYTDGMITYKTYVGFNNCEISADVIEDSVYIPVFMFDKYGKGLLRVMLGEITPLEGIHESESTKKDV